MANTSDADQHLKCRNFYAGVAAELNAYAAALAALAERLADTPALPDPSEEHQAAFLELLENLRQQRTALEKAFPVVSPSASPTP